jgi:hypothetical protein
MTITLHLWLIPLLITIISLLISWVKSDKQRFGIDFFVYGFISLFISLISWICYVIYLLI